MADAKWYVVHTYSGYENKVKANLEKAIENRHLEDLILEVSVPMQEVIEEKEGKKQQVQKKMFPAYVLVHMVMNDETWYIVRNTRGVTGFVGPGSKPVPLTEEELHTMGLLMKAPQQELYSIGDTVTVISGLWEGMYGVIKSINPNQQQVTINMDMFGRETPVELSYSEIEKV